MGGRGRLVLLAGLGIDDFGAGLFLPLSVVYATTVVGLPLGLAGTIITIGTVAGLLVPPLAGRLTDRIGPKPVVIAAQLAQAGGGLRLPRRAWGPRGAGCDRVARGWPAAVLLCVVRAHRGRGG